MAVRVAIVGRPNVGKSTLFNRIAGKRLALVHDRPGVTRDRRETPVRFGDLELILVDTAGFEEATGPSLEAAMRAQTQAAVADADVCLFVIDARAGVTPVDEAFADVVRRADTPIVLIANKCESFAGDTGLAESYGLGLGEPVAVSAEHGEGMSDLYQALSDVAEGFAAPDDDNDMSPDAPIRIAVVGRPNAGKSTLINRMIGSERLLTGPEPGVTRDAIMLKWAWDGKRIQLNDTAGLRKKAKVDDEVERLSTSDTVRALRFAQIVVLVLDAANAFEKQDLQIADLAIREGRGVVFAVTKWDLVKNRQELAADLRERAGRLLPQVRGAPVIAVSGVTGYGLDKLMQAVVDLHVNWSAKVKTRDLNDWLSEAIARHPPPAVNGRRIKPRYITQTKSRPPTFVLICSRAAQLPEAYKRYLVNGVREAFELPATPIRLHVRAGKNPYTSDADGAKSRA